MPVTLTIKQVPESVAESLRQRAAANRRSLQRELLLIVERAASGDGAALHIAEPAAPAYNASDAAKTGKPARKPPAERNAGKLSLDALWQRARKLGAPMPGESTAMVRSDRDARDRR